MEVHSRMSSLLPSVKCSHCGADIEISRMGDHVCAPANAPALHVEQYRSPPAAAAAPPPAASTRMSFRATLMSRKAPPPANINPVPLGRTVTPDLPTPASIASQQSDTRSASPSKSFLRPKSPFRIPFRSNTTAARRPPSPEIPLAQECAFPAFPISPKLPPGSRPAPIQRANTDNFLQTPSSSRAPSPLGQMSLTAPVSQRPFDGSHSTQFAGQRDDDRQTGPSPLDQAFQPPSSSPPRATGEREAAFGSAGSFPQANSESSDRIDHPVDRPEAEESRDWGLENANPFSQPQSASSKPPDSAAPSERPKGASHRHTRSIHHFRQPSVSAASRPLNEIGSFRPHRRTASRTVSPPKIDTDTTPRSASAAGDRNDQRLGDAPPVPDVGKVAGDASTQPASAVDAAGERRPVDRPLPAPHMRTGPSPNHTPTESISSNGSTENTASSHSSPPMSTASFGQTFQSLDAAPTTNPFAAMAPIEPPTGPLPQPRRKPAKSFSRPTYARPAPAEPPSQSHPPPLSQTQPPPPPPPSSSEPQPPESPMDPAIQGNRLPPLITDAPPRRPDLAASRSATTPAAARDHPDAVRTPLSAPARPDAPPARRPGTASGGERERDRARPPCRGCGAPIVGKGVSAADGRIEGRWHRGCFGCRTCRAPFATGDFYVWRAAPYCARHYHVLAGSLCAGCDRGIEGPCVEADRRRFHPHCFRCSECELILRDDYFDVRGDILCERHALPRAGANKPLPGARPEKRSTRLMMMTMI